MRRVPTRRAASAAIAAVGMARRLRAPGPAMAGAGGAGRGGRAGGGSGRTAAAAVRAGRHAARRRRARRACPGGGSSGCVGSCQNSRCPAAALALLLAQQVVVALGGERSRPSASLRTTVGLRKTIRLVLLARARVVAEQRADERDVAEQRHLVRAVGEPVLDQAAQHDDLAVVDDHRGLDRALVGDEARRRCRSTPARARPPGRSTGAPCRPR